MGGKQKKTQKKRTSFSKKDKDDGSAVSKVSKIYIALQIIYGHVVHCQQGGLSGLFFWWIYHWGVGLGDDSGVVQPGKYLYCGFRVYFSTNAWLS